MKVNFKVKMKVTIEFPVEKYFRNCIDLFGKLCLFQITSNSPGTLQLTYDVGTYLNVVFFALSIVDVKKGGFHFKKNKVDLQKAMKVNFKVKMKVTIEFLVEIYFSNDLYFFEKYFT